MSSLPPLTIRKIKAGDEENIKTLIHNGQWPSVSCFLDEAFHGYAPACVAAISSLVGGLFSIPFRHRPTAALISSLIGGASVPLGLITYYQAYHLPWTSEMFLDRPFLSQCIGTTPCTPGTEGSAVWVAERDGKTVGTVSLHCNKDGRGELRRMYIDTQVRGGGIGSAMVQELLEHAREHKVKGIDLATGGLRQPAVTFYQKNGWTHYRVIQMKIMGMFPITLHKMTRTP